MCQSLLLSLVILLLTYFGDVCGVAAKTIQQEQEPVKPLTNENVLTLVKSHLAPDLIATRLLRNGCDCVVSTDELERLKAEGVPYRVILAMISATNQETGESLILTIPRGTVVEIETADRLTDPQIVAKVKEHFATTPSRFRSPT